MYAIGLREKLPPTKRNDLAKKSVYYNKIVTWVVGR